LRGYFVPNCLLFESLEFHFPRPFLGSAYWSNLQLPAPLSLPFGLGDNCRSPFSMTMVQTWVQAVALLIDSCSMGFYVQFAVTTFLPRFANLMTILFGRGSAFTTAPVGYDFCFLGYLQSHTRQFSCHLQGIKVRTLSF
jgi:hypothetical protein